MEHLQSIDQIALKYGGRLETLSVNQKFALVALLAARACAPECLPDDLISLTWGLSHIEGLSLMESLIACLKASNRH
jgi:hypothetical protein